MRPGEITASCAGDLRRGVVGRLVLRGVGDVAGVVAQLVATHWMMPVPSMRTSPSMRLRREEQAPVMSMPAVPAFVTLQLPCGAGGTALGRRRRPCRAVGAGVTGRRVLVHGILAVGAGRELEDGEDGEDGEKGRSFMVSLGRGRKSASLYLRSRDLARPLPQQSCKQSQMSRGPPCPACSTAKKP